MVEDLDSLIAQSTHPRMIGTGFLQICSTRVKRAYAYWDTLRRDRVMPARGDIDPLQIPDLLPFVVLTEVLPEAPWLRYRLVGTRQVQMRGHDPTGKAVAGNHIGHHLATDTVDEVLLNYWVVIGKRCPVYDYNTVLGPTRDGGGSLDIGQVRERGTLLLPLGQNGETVDMVFCIADVDPA